MSTFVFAAKPLSVVMMKRLNTQAIKNDAKIINNAFNH
jgi:hypothetical protein